MIDNPYEYWRVINALLSVICLVWLAGAIIQQRHGWNAKTRDLWYSRIMWSLAGLALSIEGIIRGIGLSVSLVLITAAVLATCKALFTRGSWGYDKPNNAPR